MRTSLPEIRQTASTAGPTVQNLPPERGPPPSAQPNALIGRSLESASEAAEPAPRDRKRSRIDVPRRKYLTDRCVGQVVSMPKRRGCPNGGTV